MLDESPDKLGKQYKTGSTELYDRLKALFTVIDQGSDELNMPTYNGGLFSPETDSGQFLATYAIPDYYLALGLDRLTRDVDDRTKALVFIDFKSLGVRHLGSIYEGLLEFKLQIAREKLAVTKEKGKEVYKPAEQVKKPLAIIDKGEVYLENDKQERKATGSYYTPDYIVKYIVRHTVGPVLDRKFAELEKRLRDAQRGYRKYARLVEARRKSTGRDESAAVYWNSPEMRNLVDDCLNVRVLDPAMGSGHFLVEVVDYVTNRLIDFLNGWSENPVWAFLEQTRTDALIDKIVYRLYGLTDAGIELIERPQYEQALADAKAQVVADDKIKDDEEKIEKIAAGILPAAKRFFERVEPKSIEVMLDSELPNWRSLPPDAPTFLLTGDYNLHTLPEHMDFSSSVIPYTKAVETVLYERIFAPFRDGSGYAEADCNNEFLKDFMRGKKKLTLGNFMIILRSSRETALQTFISCIYPDAAQCVFGAKGLVATLNDEGMLDIRNKAAHDEVLSRDEAQQTRAWAMQILEQV